MFKIGDYSKLTHVSIRMLRYYDEIGLFKPLKVDDFTSYRYYSASQIPRLNKIISLRNLGFNASEISEVLSEKDTNKHIEYLKQKRLDIKNDISIQQSRITQLDNYINDYNKESVSMSYEVIVKSVPSMKVVSLRKELPNYQSEGILWGEFMEKVHRNGVKIGKLCYAEFHDEKHMEDGVDVEIAEEVLELRENVEGLIFKEVEEIEKAATCLVSGDYVPNIQEGFNFMATWLENNNYTISGPSRTYYIVGPGSDTDPKNYLTEIVIPIKK